jgi:hypothetical protein
MKRPLKELEKEVLRRATEELRRVGLERRSHHWFGKRIGELEAAIGVGIRTYPELKRLEVRTVVGVRHEELERLREILGRDTDGEWYPSVTVAVANIAPETMEEETERDYVVHVGEDPSPVVRWVVRCAEEFGPRFWSENSTLREITATVASQRFPVVEERFLPIAYYLLGDRAAAEGVMRRYTRPDSDPNSSYQVFCRRVREMFDRQSA